LACDVDVTDDPALLHRQDLRLPIGPGAAESRAVDPHGMANLLAPDESLFRDDRSPELQKRARVARARGPDRDALRDRQAQPPARGGHLEPVEVGGVLASEP